MIRGGDGSKTQRASRPSDMATRRALKRSFLQVANNLPDWNDTMALYGNLRGKTHDQVVTRAAGQANWRCCTRAEGVPRGNLKKGILSAAYDPTKWKSQTRTKTGKRKKLTALQSKGNEKRAYYFRLASKRGARKNTKISKILVSKTRKPVKIPTKVPGVSDNKRYLTKAAATIRNKGRSASGAMAAGFLKSAQLLGVKKRGAKNIQPAPGGTASKSKGQKAVGDMAAHSINKVAGSYEVGRKTMLKAIKRVIADMRDFAEKLIEEAADEAIEKGGTHRRR